VKDIPKIPPAIVLHRTGIRPHGKWEWVLGIEWKLADLWIGAFWKRKGHSLDIWVCLLPCLPIHWTGWRFKEPQ
jgi:hypothetical protein